MQYHFNTTVVRRVAPSAAVLVGASLIAAQLLVGVAPAAADPPELPGTLVTDVASVQQLDSSPVPTFLVR